MTFSTARPILMHGRSIQNLLAGRKTQTRRIVKVRNLLSICRGDSEHYRRVSADGCVQHCLNDVGMAGLLALCPYGAPGDLLWVRERHSFNEPVKSSARGDDAHWIVGVEYSDGSERPMRFDRKPKKTRQRGEIGWLPSIHMPRRLSRLTLRLTDVRVERVQATGFDDIVSEGVMVPVHDGHAVIELTGKSPPAKFLTKDQLGDVGALLRAHWASLWDNTNGSGSWERNDWVWALSFEVLRQNVDGVLKRVAA